MNNFEEELKELNAQKKYDMKMLKISQSYNEMILTFGFLFAGIISLKMTALYNTMLFVFAMTRIVTRVDYYKYVRDYLNIKRDYILFLCNYDAEKIFNEKSFKKIVWDNSIDSRAKAEKVYAVIITVLYVVNPILQPQLNYLISSIISIVAIWTYIALESRKMRIAKEACTLGNNLITRKELLEHKEKEKNE